MDRHAQDLPAKEHQRHGQRQGRAHDHRRPQAHDRQHRQEDHPGPGQEVGHQLAQARGGVGLLLEDALYIASNITFENLAPLSTYIGKPGDPAKGGITFDEYMLRQNQHRTAEIAATVDAVAFIDKARDIYGYANFINDTSGSICEVVNPNDLQDPVLKCLSETTLLCWIEGSEEHRNNLIERFDLAPKPMYYEPGFINAKWNEYLDQTGQNENEVDPDAFVRWTYAEALAHRHPRYEGISKWGIKVRAEDVAVLKTVMDFEELVARALEQREQNS